MQSYNLMLVPVDPRAIGAAPFPLGINLDDKEELYSRALHWIRGRYPNDDDKVVELAGEESALGLFKEGLCSHVVVLVEEEYLTIYPR